MQQDILKLIRASIDTKEKLFNTPELIQTIERLVKEITNTFRSGGKVLFCGNGGSAADAQHLAAEFSGRFYFDRDPLPSEALHCNTSFLTAVANDYSYDIVYSRMVKAIGKPGDILIALSTSGNSVNIIKAVEQAKQIGMVTACFTGETGGKLKTMCDYLLNVPSTDTPRIQETHILIGHIVCQLTEEQLFKKEKEDDPA